MKRPIGFDEFRDGDAIVWVRSELRSCFEGRPLLPDDGPPPDGEHPEPLTGRGGTFALAWPGLEGEIVHRRLKHGGALRAFTRDRFWEREPRPFVEAELSERLRGLGVSTPEVVHAVIRRGALGSYRGAVATRRVLGARALADVLLDAARNSDPEAARVLLEEAGALTRKLNDARVFHVDLNLRNLIVEARMHPGSARPALQVIDLDRSRTASRPLSRSRRRANLARLLRSLEKFPDAQLLTEGFAFEALLAGYDRGVPESERLS